MPVTANYFASHYYDRMAWRRDNEAWLEKRRKSDNARFLPVAGSENLFTDGPPPTAALLGPEQVDGLPYPQVYLGEYTGDSCFAILVGEDHDACWAGTSYHQLLQRVSVIGSGEASLLAFARAISIWHRNHQHCGRCGAGTLSAHAGHVLACSDTSCGWQQFPRVDPAIIVLVSDGERCLLGRQAAWDTGRYSTIAGFVEPGESLEDAVIREVQEETGIAAHSPVYHSSQPWPFPSSLMLGFQASGRKSKIQLRDGELEHADWFTPDDLSRGGLVRLAPPISISRQLIDKWYEDRTGDRLVVAGQPPNEW